MVATSVAALTILWLLDTQIYTEPWTVDPWLYTALMTNFDTIYGWFTATYYASRLPVIIPGLFLNSFLTPQQAYVVLHLVMFFTGGAFLYLLVRWLFGVRIALFVYPAVLTNAAYVDAHTWDYVDGFVITYLAAGLYFLVSSIGGTSRVRPALAGFFLAAAAASNLFATLLIAGAVAAYLYGRRRVDGRLAVESPRGRRGIVRRGRGGLADGVRCLRPRTRGPNAVLHAVRRGGQDDQYRSRTSCRATTGCGESPASSFRRSSGGCASRVAVPSSVDPRPDRSGLDGDRVGHLRRAGRLGVHPLAHVPAAPVLLRHAVPVPLRRARRLPSSP